MEGQPSHWSPAGFLQTWKRSDVAGVCIHETSTKAGEYAPGYSGYDVRWEVVAILRGGEVLRRSFQQRAARTVMATVEVPSQRVVSIFPLESEQQELSGKVNRWLEQDARQTRSQRR